MNDSDSVIGILSGVGTILVLLVLAAIVGSVKTNSEWQDDCEKIGLHREGDKVYECKLKVKL